MKSFRLIEKVKIKIKEWINLTKNKHQGILTCKDMKNIFYQLELNLRVFQKSENLTHFLTRLYNIINETLRMLKIKLDLFSSIQESEINALNNKLKRVQSLGNRPLTLNIKDAKILNLSILYRLEIEYFTIRPSVLHSSRGQIQWLHSQLERNKHTQKHIEEYQKQYFLNNQRQRNKNRPYLYPKINNKQHLRVKTTAHQKFYHNFDKNRRIQTKEKENSLCGITKDIYKINNLYVSGNQFDIFGQNMKNKSTKLKEDKKKSSLLLCRVFRDSLTTKNNCSKTKQLIKFLK